MFLWLKIQENKIKKGKRIFLLPCIYPLNKEKNKVGKIFEKRVDKTGLGVYNNYCCQRTTTHKMVYGSLAQLGEHLPYKQRVIGSSPITPTILAR